MRKKPKKEVMPWRQGLLSHHQRGSMKQGDYTKVTDRVREEVNRRSQELLDTDIPVCERCGSPRELCKSHIQEASHRGAGFDPANIINLCGTHGTKGCHEWSDQTFAGRQWKKQYGAMLRLYYAEGNGKNYWSYKEEA
jgi:hypothetical protein